MRFRSLIIMSLLFFVAGNALAQPKKGDVYIRTNLLSLIEPYASGPTVGLEYFFNNHFSMGTDAGFILYDVAKSENDHMGNPKGFKIKPELRYYLYKQNMEKRVRLFFGLEGLYLKTSTRNYNPLPITDNMGNVLYTYLGGYDEVKKVTGGVAKAGIQIPRFIFKKMIMEIYAGVGVRNKIYSYKDFPAGASFPDRELDWTFFNTDIDGVYPSVSAGFKIVYRIN